MIRHEALSEIYASYMEILGKLDLIEEIASNREIFSETEARDLTHRAGPRCTRDR